MVNEMGNTNSSGDHQENAAVDTQQKGEAAAKANGVKEENNIVPQGESKESQFKNSEDDKTDESKRETQTFQCSEVQSGSNDSVSEVTNIQTHTSPRKDEFHEQPFDEKGEEEESLPHDEILKSEPVEYSSIATETVEEHFISSSREEQETPEKGRSGQDEDKTQLISSEIALADKTTVVADANDQNVTTQQNECLAGELAASGDMSNEEKHENMSAENQVEDGYSIRADLDETPKVEHSQSDATGSLLADSPRITPSSSFATVVEPQDKCMVPTPETELSSNESAHLKEATEKKPPANNVNTDNATEYSIENDKARGDINVQPDILYLDHAPAVEQQVNSEETYEMVPEVVLPTKFIGTATNLEEESSTEDGLLEKAKEMTEKCISQTGSSKLENGFDIAYADGRMQGFESVGDQKERNSDLIEHDNGEFTVTEDSGVFELKISEDEIAKIADFAEAENAQDVQTSLETLAVSNGKRVFGQKVPNFHYETPSKAPDSIGRVSLETIPEKSSNGIELRKSPSFDFGVHRRSSESDQTPLLCPERTPTRSLSVGSNANFSNSITRTGYNRSSLNYEAVEVEEKTIRVERSDSDISTTPLLSLSNKGENNGNLKVTSETQQNHVAVMKVEDLQASQEKETSLTSPKGSGKRKPRPSFFSTCICCTAATHY